MNQSRAQGFLTHLSKMQSGTRNLNCLRAMPVWNIATAADAIHANQLGGANSGHALRRVMNASARIPGRSRQDAFDLLETHRLHEVVVESRIPGTLLV